MTTPDLFSTPIKAKVIKSRNVTAYKYDNGTINIDGHKFIGYSMTEAIKQYLKTTKQ